MTDEEMAEEYVNNQGKDNILDFGENHIDVSLIKREAFLAGLKARNCISSGASVCTNLCKHCMYVECGDFTCDIDDDATIVGWKPFPCKYPEKRCIKEVAE